MPLLLQIQFKFANLIATMNQSPSLLAQPEEATALVAAPIGILDGSDDLLAPSPRSDVGITSPPSSPMKSVSLRDLGVMQVPTANHYASRSGKVQCIMSERDGGNKIVLSYQLENGTEVPVLMALRQKTVKVLPKYHLFDISADGNTHAKLTKEDPQYLGKVRRDKNIRIHAFALSVPVEDVGLDDSAEETYEQSMYVLYELPSLTSVLLRKDPPRRAQVAVYSEPADVNGLGNRLAHMVSASKKATGHLDNVSDPASGLFAFANKEPYKKVLFVFAVFVRFDIACASRDYYLTVSLSWTMS
jgi:hypothetical protein